MENALVRPALSFSTMAQAGFSIMRHLLRLLRVSEGNRPAKTTAGISDHLRRDIGLNPTFSANATSYFNIWRI